MSLKSFHLVFVTVTTLLFAFLAIWAFVLAPETGVAATVLGSLGVAGAMFMPVYGVLFYRKAARIHL